MKWIATIYVAASSSLVLLTGCTMNNTPQVLASPGLVVRGAMHGGQQPVGGALIQLYAAGSNGYGSTATPLFGPNPVYSNSDGSFTFPAYTCPSASANVYVVGMGGNPGAVNNPNLALMTALGPCGLLTPSTYIQVNELTTVASVWALAPFMQGIGSVGTSATNSTGLTNAFAAVNELVDTASGTVSGLTLPAGAVLPVAKIDTLADIVAACINSAGGIAGDGSACGTLFTSTTVSGAAPTNTIAAALALAQHPNLNAGALWATTSATSPYQPTLAAAPADFALAIQYVGGGLSSPSGIAADSTGSLWIANAGNNSVTKLDNSGNPLSGASGFMAGSFSYPSAIAVDPLGSIWVANAGNDTVSQLSPDGASATVYSGGDLDIPSTLAVDATNNIWVANKGTSTLTQIGASGAVNNVASNSIATPSALAIDSR